MYQTTITLKQHTPIIHFQHDQEGATLRATEVKPKLDRFILEKKGDWDNIDDSWKIGGGVKGQEALNYKIKIKEEGRRSTIEKNQFNEAITPMFFANLGDKKKGKSIKEPVLYENKRIGKEEIEAQTVISFFSFEKNLIDFIEKNISDFFAKSNFGMRQSKGYGSFFVVPEDVNYKSIEEIGGYHLKFSSESNSWVNALSEIELFYKLLRSGINEVRGFKPEDEDGKVYNIKSNSVAYCKPIIFLFAKEKLKLQWDKKSIKSHFFSRDFYKRKISKKEGYRIKDRLDRDAPIYEIFEPGLPQQKEQHKEDNEGPLFFDQDNEKGLILLRDLFGLSTDQAWRSYAANISKEHLSKSKDGQIDRMKSPLLFKVLYDHNLRKYDIYLFAEPISKSILGETFKVTATSEKGHRNKDLNILPKPMNLKFPEEFSWDLFFNYLKNDFKLDKAFQVGRNGDTYKTLKAIIDQIQN